MASRHFDSESDLSSLSDEEERAGEHPGEQIRPALVPDVESKISFSQSNPTLDSTAATNAVGGGKARKRKGSVSPLEVPTSKKICFPIENAPSSSTLRADVVDPALWISGVLYNRNCEYCTLVRKSPCTSANLPLSQCTKCTQKGIKCVWPPAKSQPKGIPSFATPEEALSMRSRMTGKREKKALKGPDVQRSIVSSFKASKGISVKSAQQLEKACGPLAKVKKIKQEAPILPILPIYNPLAGWETVRLGGSTPSTFNTSQAASTPKPLPPACPPVWAETRQELCETLPYYRAYQSGLYMSGGVAFGYLLDGFPAARDIWAAEGKVIVSHGGGKCVSVEHPATASSPPRIIPTLREDQNDKDCRVATLLRAWKRRQPIVLLAGRNYTHLPWNIGKAAYVVLGWYQISLAWVEPELPAPGFQAPEGRPYLHRYKLRFDWCDGQGEPWFLQSLSGDLKGWEPGDKLEMCDKAEPVGAFACPAVGDPFDESLLRKPPGLSASRWPPEPVPETHLQQLCTTCEETSDQIYKEAWFCLRPDCSSFWKVYSKQPETGLWRQILVNPDSILQYSEDFLVHRSSPASLSIIPFHLDAEQTGRSSSKTRLDGRGTICTRCRRAACRESWHAWTCPACGYVDDSEEAPPSIALSESIRPIRTRISASLEISMQVCCIGPTMIYTFPDAAGTVYHVRCSNRSSADNMMDLYANASANPMFRRSALSNHKISGRLLAQHYTLNSGKAYKYVACGDMSLSFEESPKAVRTAYYYVTMAVKELLGAEAPVFNELLSVLYKDEQKMGFHDDGETGIGPVIASVSLGSDALMMFRQKRARDYANSSYDRSPKKMKPGPEEETENILQLVLSHGDVMIMSGRAFQEMYEHSVIPCGPRVAATLRTITDSGESMAQAVPGRDANKMESGKTEGAAGVEGLRNDMCKNKEQRTRVEAVVVDV